MLKVHKDRWKQLLEILKKEIDQSEPNLAKIREAAQTLSTYIRAEGRMPAEMKPWAAHYRDTYLAHKGYRYDVDSKILYRLDE